MFLKNFGFCLILSIKDIKKSCQNGEDHITFDTAKAAPD